MRFLFLTVLLIFLTACERDPDFFTIGEPFEIAYDEELAIEGTTITVYFSDVIDNRCVSDEACDTDDNAQVFLDVGGETLILNTTIGQTQAEFRDLNFSLENLSPEPNEEDISNELYQATLLVTE